jgi:hypothetical protein
MGPHHQKQLSQQQQQQQPRIMDLLQHPQHNIS